jgi:adenine-specific DNA methylase
VLTDPPYFDDVQYAELASLFLVWARALRLFPDEVKIDFGSEAVVNSKRGTDTLAYRDILTRIFKEARRSLRTDGLLVITFHNSDLRAWWALAQALDGAGFSVAAMAIAHSENETDHAKRGRRAFSRDLVLECVTHGAPVKPAVYGADQTAEETELFSAGRTVARLRTCDYDEFRSAFLEACGATRPVLIKPATVLSTN